MTRTVALVPRRSDGGRRDEVWAWVRARWEREHSDIPIFEGHDDGPGKFSRSLAINRAAEAAGDWDAAHVGDADSLVSPAQIRQAFDNALHSNCEFWLTYDVFFYLRRDMSDQIMSGYTGYWEAGQEWSMTGTCSSSLVVTRRLWDEVGGFDERFVGWGFEDIGFSHACQTFGGGVSRIPGPAYHLHHPPSPENDHRSPEWQAGRDLMQRYHAVAYDRDGMRALLDER